MSTRTELLDATLRRFPWRLNRARAVIAAAADRQVSDAELWLAFMRPGTPTEDDLLELIEGEFDRVCRTGGA